MVLRGSSPINFNLGQIDPSQMVELQTLANLEGQREIENISQGILNDVNKFT